MTTLATTTPEIDKDRTIEEIPVEGLKPSEIGKLVEFS